MRWCVGWQRERLSKKPSTDRRHDSQQRERETAEIKRERAATGQRCQLRKTNEDANLKRDDSTPAGWD